MEPLIPIFILVGVGIAIVSAIAGSSRWKEVAAELGLQFSQGLRHSMSGTIEGFPIHVLKHKNTIEVRLTGNGAIPSSIRFNAEGMLRNVLSGRDIEVGCPSFDGRTHISNWGSMPETVVSALLDHKTRSVVSQVVVNRRATVAQGEITLNASMTVGETIPVVREFVLLAKHLTMKPPEIPGRLSANALGDPVSAVQLRNLTLLQQSYPDSSEATETSRALLESPHHSIRLAAAIFLGPEGHAVVREMALSGRVPTDLRVKALRHLSAGSDRGDMIEIATTLLPDRDAMVQRMAVQSLGRLQHGPSLDPLVALLDTGEVATTLEIVKALENIGDPSAETALIALLGDARNRVVTATIEALGALGTIRAVEQLHELTEQRRFKRAARMAIDSIQSRLGDVESGRLSLATTIDPDGALSLAGDPEKAGGLSLDEEDDRR